ncbi:MAG: pyridoxal phosphate-dependent aminotransferase [Woeseia sp.]
MNKGFGMYETAASMQSRGADIIHLEVGRPSNVTPRHIREAAKSALDKGIVHYGDLQGLGALREALAARYSQERGVNYTANEILITNGVTQAAYAAFMSGLDEGDEVIVLAPFYPQHNSKIRLAGARVVEVPLAMRGGMFRLDADALEDAITSVTRMVVLINPANPIGTVYTKAELEDLASIAKRHDLLVLSDEVYEYITFDESKHISFASLPEMKERTITVNAFTKAYAMDGWRIGYAAAPAHIIADLRRVTMNTTTHPCVFAQEGALVAVTSSQDCVKEMVDEDRRRRDLVVESLNLVPGITCPVPQGTIYAFPDVRGFGVMSDQLALQILESAHVAVESGSFYGRNGQGHLRICFGSEPYDRVSEAMHRLTDYLTSENVAKP